MNDQDRGQWTSASNAQADALCPGRHRAQLGLPEAQSSDAGFGRIIHAALAKGDDSGLDADQRDIYDACRQIEDRLGAQYFGNEPPTKVWVEERFWCGVDSLRHSGQTDKVYRRLDRALIIEYKTLVGDVPTASTNLQLRDQATLLALNAALLSEIAVVVVQPLVTHSPELCIYKPDDLERAAREMYERVRRSNDPNSPRMPGEVQCRFCRAKDQCLEYQQWAGGMVPAMQSLLDVPVSAWTPEQRAVFLERRAVAQKWLDDAEAAMKRLLAQDAAAIPGWELKDGARRVKIKDAQTLMNRFAELGGDVERFIKCIDVVKGRFTQQVADVTGEKGQALNERMERLLDGISESKQNAPSLVKKKP